MKMEEGFGNSILSKDAAQKEADMMQARMRVAPDGPNAGKLVRRIEYSPLYRDGEHFVLEAPTADDYEKAANAIDELRKLAESEPATEKVLYTLARIGQTSAKALGLVIMGLGDLATTDMTGRGTASMMREFDKTKTKFWDAARKLKEAERKGEEYSKDPMA